MRRTRAGVMDAPGAALRAAKSGTESPGPEGTRAWRPAPQGPRGGRDAGATQGGMTAIIGLNEAATRKVSAEAGVVLANLNCPGQLVISGATEKLAPACALAKAKGAMRALPLTVAGAYHSPLMAERKST